MTAALIALLALAFAPGVPAQETGEWALLGPLGPREIVAIAPSPGWPDDGLLLAARPDGLVRTADGGVTWELLPLPAPDVRALRLVPSTDGARTAFAITGADQQPKTLYRSTDDGASWAVALPAIGVQAELVVSPDAARDGLALLVADGRLHRSGNSGATWEQLDPSPGQRVQQALFSPDFARDRTIFLAAVSAPFPSLGDGVPRGQPSVAHEQSDGVLFSTDAGESWASASAGPETGGVPHRLVEWIAISPTYAQDGTLFAFGWGLPYQEEGVEGLTKGLFRSGDRGASWASVGSFRNTGRLFLALSPAFAGDGVALYARNTYGTTGSSTNCAMSRSGDGGQSWTSGKLLGSYQTCRDLWLVGSGEAMTGFIFQFGFGWLRSTDGGESWPGLNPPTYDPSSGFVRAIFPSPAFERDRTILVGTDYGGIWAVGPGARATNGRLPCAAEPAGGFARVLDAEVRARARLGCPLAPEQAVQIRERRVGLGRAFWTEDDPTWFEVSDSPPDRWGEYKSHSKAGDPLPPGPEQVLDGAVQRFEGGTMLFLPRPDGRRTILVLGLKWRELAD